MTGIATRVSIVAAIVLLAVGTLSCSSITERDGREEYLVLGMAREKALPLLRQNGVHAAEWTGAFGSADENTLAVMYYVETPKSPDALFVYMEKRPDEAAFRVARMYWHQDWQGDSKRAKGKRRDVERPVQRIPVSALRKWVRSGTFAVN